MAYKSDQRVIFETIGVAAIGSVCILIGMVCGMLHLTETGSVEEQYLLVVVVCLVAVFVLLFGAFLIIESILTMRDRCTVDHVLGNLAFLRKGEIDDAEGSSEIDAESSN